VLWRLAWKQKAGRSKSATKGNGGVEALNSGQDEVTSRLIWMFNGKWYGIKTINKALLQRLPIGYY